MSDLAIRVDNLGKEYRIGKRERYRTLRDSIVETVRSVFQSAKGSAEDAEDTIWALKNVSFEVKKGEVIGVIGRNGAGKSTLLKALSRITEPTAGRVEIHGRVGSLLEVGTGFHPELTGRENIFLNGAILGMRRTEIAAKFDEIVAFAEIDKFVDTPVKHYSSGMYMRLAFAVAAHLEPEILIVDEVLAVGDVQFQKKCLGKMGEVASGGRTVLFVSHNLLAVGNLCPRSILLNQGRLQLDAISSAVIDQYSRTTEEIANEDLALRRSRRYGSGDIRFRALDLLATDSSSKTVRAGDPFKIRLAFKCDRAVRNPVFSIALFSVEGLCLFALRTTDSSFAIPEIEGMGEMHLDVLNPNLLPGRYLIHCAVGDQQDPHRYDHVMDAAVLDLQPADVYSSGRIEAAGWSSLFFNCNWQLCRQ